MATLPFLKPIDERLDSAPLHPGEILREDVLPFYKMSPADLAGRLSVPQRVIDDIISEKARITRELADLLSRVLGFSAAYWRALQMQYDLWQEQLDAAGMTAVPVRIAR